MRKVHVVCRVTHEVQQWFSGGGDSCCEIVRPGLCDGRMSSSLLSVNSVLLT